MGKNKQENIKKVGFTIVVLILVATYFLNMKALTLKPNVLNNLTSLFGYLLLISLFVERSIEMFLSAWRSQGADILDRKIEKLKNKIESENTDTESKKTVSELNKQLEEINDERAEYRAKSRFIALWIGLTIGILVAMVGVRILGNIVEASSLTGEYNSIFVIVDVIITGSVLAGGSDSINKIMKVYNNIMSKTAEKAKL